MGVLTWGAGWGRSLLLAGPLDVQKVTPLRQAAGVPSSGLAPCLH